MKGDTGRGHVKAEAEIGITLPQAKRKIAGQHWEQEEAGRVLPQGLGGSTALPTLDSGPMASAAAREYTSIVSRPSVYGNLL